MDNEKIRALIDQVKKFPILYDPDNSGFRHKDQKENYWRNIGKNLKIPGDVAEVKWKYLKNHLSKTMRDEVNGVTPKKAWVWAEEMAFFRPYIRGYEHQQQEIITIPVDPTPPKKVTCFVGDEPILISEQTQDSLYNHLVTSYPRTNGIETNKPSSNAQVQTRSSPRQSPVGPRKRRVVDAPSSRIAEPGGSIPPSRRWGANGVASVNSSLTSSPSTSIGLCQPSTSAPTPNSVPSALWMAGRLNGATQPQADPRTSSPTPSRASMTANAVHDGPFDTVDFFMLKCAVKMKLLPPDAQAELQILINESISRGLALHGIHV